MNRMMRGLAIAGLMAASFACESEDATTNEPPPEEMGETGPTWHQDVAPIIHGSCVGCHHEGGIGQFPLETYAQAAPLAGAIADAVASGRMPPWGAAETESCTPRTGFKDDIRLSDANKALLADWAATNAAEGDAATAAALPEVTLDVLEGIDQQLASPVPFTTVGSTDQFRCFVLDPELTEEGFVSGVHFKPGNTKVVHHLLLYVDQGGTDALELADDTGSYDCFGDSGVDAELLAAWAPGGVPTEFPAGSGFRLAPGAKLVMQVHYHPTGPDTPEEDTTTVQLRYTDSTPEYLAFTALLGNFDDWDEEDRSGLLPAEGEDVEQFLIPANASDHTEKMVYTIPSTFDDKPFPGMFLHSVASHMHYVGTDMKVHLRRPEKVGACEEGAIAPLRTCLDANCADMSGQEMVDCAVGNCGGEVGELSGDCQNCLVGQLTVGSDDIYSPCQAPALPTHYGELPAQPDEECLLQTPDWDFNWQRFYTYDVDDIHDLPYVVGGDVFEFECTFDNSMNNRFVREALSEQGLSEPIDVVLGDETLDEMCLVALTVLYKWPEAE